MKIFVSYSRVDKDIVLKLVEALGDYDLTIWMDVRNIPHGANWDMEVQRGLDESDLMLIMLSPDSVASQNVADEWNYFLTSDKPVIPVIIRPSNVPFRLARRQYVDVSQSLATGFPQLLRALGSPRLRDPDATAKLPKFETANIPAVKPGDAPPISLGQPVTSSVDSPKSNKPQPATPTNRIPSGEPAVALEVRTFPITWAHSYHWLNGMRDGFTEGELLINTRELLFVPLDRPVISVPFKNIIRASENAGIGGIDPHVYIEYYGADGKAARLVMMGAVPAKRAQVNSAVVEVANKRRAG